jgi:hypothetical protein
VENLPLYFEKRFERALEAHPQSPAILRFGGRTP